YGGSDTVDYTVSAATGASGQTASGTASLVKDSGPTGGLLNCVATSTAVSASESGSGFSFVVNASTHTSNRFVCSPDTVGTYTFHVHFADSDGNYNDSSSSPAITLVVDKADTSTTASHTAAG